MNQGPGTAMKMVNRVSIVFKSDVKECVQASPSGSSKVGGVLRVRVGNSLKIVCFLNALQSPPVSISILN